MKTESLSNKELVKNEIIDAYIAFEQEPTTGFDEMVDMLAEYFGKTSVNTVISGIRKGASGEFGYFHKINPHTIAVWIQCQKQSCKPNDLKRQKERL